MIIKANGRSALIFAAGLFVLLATPVNATDGDDAAADAKSDNSTAAPVTQRIYRHASHHRRHYAHHGLHAIAKADDDKKAAAPDTATGDNRMLAVIPPSIANANAQMLLAGAQIGSAPVAPAGTGVPATASENSNANNETLVAASDQLNDVDRTLQQGTPTATATSPPAPTATMTTESSAWDQTSLIGKIFIGFGALLTVASAARMFIT
ncbi:MAG: hypothetical protein ABSG88_01580 [Bradyrhizobium sp.]